MTIVTFLSERTDFSLPTGITRGKKMYALQCCRAVVITESWNDSGWKRPLSPSNPTCDRSPPCQSDESIECNIQSFLQCLQGWGRHLPGQPIPMPNHTGCEEILPCVQPEPSARQLNTMSSCPVPAFLGAQPNPHQAAPSCQGAVESGAGPAEAAEMRKGLEHLPAEGRLRGLGLFSPERSPGCEGPSAPSVPGCRAQALLRGPATAPGRRAGTDAQQVPAEREEELYCEGVSAGTQCPERVWSLPDWRYPSTCPVCSEMALPGQGGGTGLIPPNLTHSVLL